MATPETTLITRAEITSITTPATGRKALVLDGATIELGDTGMRDLSGMFVAGKVASGRLLVQRVGNTVTWTLVPLKLAGPVGTVHDIVKSSTLTGFMPRYAAATTMLQSDAEQARLITISDGLSIHYGLADVNYSASFTYITTNAWPTTLPGVADGQPVGI